MRRWNRVVWGVGLAVAIGGTAVPAAAQDADDVDEVTERLQEGLPLAPTWTLSETFTEGSWISLDVSPDGETIVFDLLGDLYTMPFSGGSATPLTQGMAFDGQPRFSPDGQTVVFVSDRSGGDGIWTISVDGADTVRITSGENSAYQSPEWTPDGDYIVATRQTPGQGKLWMYHRRGGSGVQLISEPANARTTGAAFGDDDRYIWYGRRTGTWVYNSPGRDYQLWVYDRETGEQSSRSSRYGGAFRPTLSPDGRWLVYGGRHVSDTGLRLRDLTTGEESWLAFPVQRDDQESRAGRDAYPGMSFTPDSREVVATYGGKIWRVPVDGSPPIEIPFSVDVELPMGPRVNFEYPISDSPTFVAKQIRDLAASPDGERMAFSLMGDIYIVDLPDGEPRRVDDGEGMSAMPAWSPDGERIAFSTYSEADGGHLYTARSNTSNVTRVSDEPGYYTQAVWSPDGEQVLAIRGPLRAYEEALTQRVPQGAVELVAVPADGGAVTLLTAVSALSRPHFVEGSDRIYATQGSRGLISMRWDGTDRRAHVQVRGGAPAGAGGQGPPASMILMAPRGDQAVAQVGNQLYTVTVPRGLGAEAPTISVANPDNASFPAARITDIGGQFPAWGADGRTVHFALGNAHFTYDLDDAHEFATRANVASGADDEDEGEDDEEEEYRPDERRIEVEFERDIPTGLIALTGARIITMDGDEVIERGDIVIRNNRIEAVGPSGSVTIPSGAERRDMSGHTIMPGYVDTHAHLRASYDVHRAQPWSYAANLAYGVTTARDPQTGSSDVITYEDFVRGGRMLGPRIYSTGQGVFSGERISSLDDARDVLRRYADYFDTKTIKMYGAGNREVRQWIIQAARELELMPTTEGSLDLRLNLTMAQDGYSGTEHNLPGVPHYDDIVQLVAQSNMATTPTIVVTYGGPWGENLYFTTTDVLRDEKLLTFTPFEEVYAKAARRAGGAGWFDESQYIHREISEFVDAVVEAGGRGGVGSHGQLQGLGYHWELWLVGASERMTNHEALKIATIVGADALGLDTDLGSLEPGKLADLVILSENPLEDLENSNTVRWVMMNGRLYSGDTLAEEWPRQRAPQGFYWQTDGAVPTTNTNGGS